MSRSLIPPAGAATVVDQLVADAVAFNGRNGLTGALLFTETHFAQVLEGDGATIAVLMTRIERDPRHTGVLIVDHCPIDARRFPDWRMAYFGPSQFVSNHVSRVLDGSTIMERNRAAGWLSDLMQQFATP